MTTPLGSDSRIETPVPASPSQAPGTFGGRLKNRLRTLRPSDLVAMAVPTLILAVMGWQKRWMTDDGLIFTRAVRQILEGNGPVYNIGERAETSTSTLWQWVLVFADPLSPFSTAETAVYLGLALSVVGFWIALNATRRVYRELSTRAYLLPAGALVFVAVPVMWDFLTAGMETGLIIFWIGTSWSLLVSVWQRPSGEVRLRRILWTAFFFGLGPLVRPDLGLAMVLLLVSLALLVRARWTRCIAILVAAGALPAAYEIVRMGYYGLIFPMPALTKEAGESLYGRGWDYLTDFNRPYRLWIPLLLLVVVAALVVRENKLATRLNRRTTILLATPVVTAFAQTLYIIKVGGDFMHGRMWLPVLLMLLLPLLLTPFTKLSTPLVAAIAAWSVACGGWMRSGDITTNSPHWRPDHQVYQVWNERGFYTNETKTDNPVSMQPHINTIKGTYQLLVHANADGRHVLYLDPNYARAFGLPVDFAMPLKPELDYPVGLVIGRLGVGGAAVPLDGIVVDLWGLSSAVGAHIEQTNFDAAGHQKLLPPAWNIALYVDPKAYARIPANFATQQEINAARHTLECGDVKELVESVTEPMSFDRFWKNLTGAFDRTKLRIPSDPIKAEQKFCKARG
ncbi:MAG: hypothetical protein HOV68_11050 [Streptomycetaceae bacterium]|nr:hypothetical protein [Streptomycetaceae bacterium]